MTSDVRWNTTESKRQDDQIHSSPDHIDKPLFTMDLLAKQKRPAGAGAGLPDLSIHHDSEPHKVRIPDGHGGSKIEGMGYVRDDLTKWNAATKPDESHDKSKDVTNSTDIIINSGAGSRAQLFNRGPRIEQRVTVPNDVVAPAPVAPPIKDDPNIVPYDGPGSRARLFRNQPRSSN